MNKLILILITLLMPACTVRVYEYPAEYGYGQAYQYQPVRGTYASYGGYAPPCHQRYDWHASGGVNLNPEVNRRRGW